MEGTSSLWQKQREWDTTYYPEDLLTKENNRRVAQTTQENALSEFIFDDRLLLSSIRKAKHY
jgi:hypothetical protein